jgi:small conductance mechanosensitive channel
MENWEENLQKVYDLAIEYGITLLLALLVLVIGLSVIKYIIKGFRKTLDKRGVDSSLKPFLCSIAGALLKIMLVISVAGMVGIEMTSFVAVLGAAGLAVGLALQGSLSNFAGGVLILILKPFKVGDFIEANGFAGTVREIQIFYTYVTTGQGQEIVVPNASLSNNAVKNYSFHENRRLDMTFGIGYSDDIDQAKNILNDIISKDERVLKDPAHSIFIEALADSSVNFHVRGWTTNGDFWDVHNGLNEKVKKAFDAAKINIPFPQMDVHVHNS